MFAHTCTACGHRSLIVPELITEVSNTAAGIVVDFACWCGAPQSMLSGRAATGTVPDAPTPRAA